MHTLMPYGKGTVGLEISDDRYLGEITSGLHHYKANKSQGILVSQALLNPVNSLRLRELATRKQNVVLIASDHTRPVPSKIIIPLMLKEIREGNPSANITILIATGCHRDMTGAELEEKLGTEMVKKEKVVIHDCDSPDMVYLGQLPSGGRLLVNKIAVNADLLVAEGFIEPHFFAGFSGGRKSLMPGIAARETVLYNHNAEFIAHPNARTGILENNPIHTDMVFAARAAGLSFICNVVINGNKEIVYAVAGDCEQAHLAGCSFIREKCQASPIPADIVIVSNGGYPLDQNIYQAVKGMTAAEATVKKGGFIIMLAKSEDGCGAPEFQKTFSEEKDLNRLISTIIATPREATRVDQWQSQIFARVLKHCQVIYVSDVSNDIVRDMHMIPAKSLEDALGVAEQLLDNKQASIVTIPDGVSVIVH